MMKGYIMPNYKDTIKEMLLKTTYEVSDDCDFLLRKAFENENDESAKMLLQTIVRNIDLAKEAKKPLCQSPGYVTIYVAGKELFIEDLEDILKEAIVEATAQGYCRPSIVDPLTRKNNGDNSGYRAPNIEYEYRKDVDYVEVIASFKGCGVELFNRMHVFTLPEMGTNYDGIKKFVLECVSNAGGKTCLPVAIGIGIGGQVDVAAKLSRKAVSTRSWLERNSEGYIADMENELLEKINSLNIGSGGMGGRVTALAVNIETAATHTAICPVVVNFHCWVARRAGVRIYRDGRVEYIKFSSNMWA